MEFHGKTQKQIGEEVKRLLGYLIGQRIDQHQPVFHSLMAIVMRHPWAEEKIGHGIEAFHISTNMMNRNGIALWIERVDGSIIDISWRKCVTQRGMTATQKLLAAMRNAIHPQIRAFRRNFVGPMQCAMCGAPCHLASHVDHVITFKTLASEFLAQHQTHPTTFDSDPTTCLPTFAAADQGFADAWKAFHLKNAQLRITCPSCNLGRNKKGEE